MKYFTRSWLNGGMSEAEHEATVASYSDYLDRVVPELPQSIAALAREPSLHDALIRRVVLDFAAQSLKLELLSGDLQFGYFDVEILYRRVEWSLLDQAALVRRAEDPETEFLYDEVERISGDTYEHRVLFWPDDEIAIRFGELEFQRKPRDGRDLERLQRPVVRLGGGD